MKEPSEGIEDSLNSYYGQSLMALLNTLIIFSLEKGWTAEIKPENHPVSKFEFDVIMGTDGRRHTLKGFRRKEFRGKLAIAITMNFVNRNTKAEARVEEISGVAFIFNQGFFTDLKDATGIDLENIVYYKDETHYFVMTAKKQSLLLKGVLKKVLVYITVICHLYYSVVFYCT